VSRKKLNIEKNFQKSIAPNHLPVSKPLAMIFGFDFFDGLLVGRQN
jgi:hypothetical protein